MAADGAVAGGRGAMRALDLYCGAGGAARGLKQAGFDVTGVDILPQPHYCGDRFIRANALDLPLSFFQTFDFVWSSPPCQAYTTLRHAPGEHRDADLIGPTRTLLIASGKPYCIENVVGAPLINPIMLCGTMFGLETPDQRFELQRHRLFETSFPILAPQCQHSGRPVIGIYGGHFRDRRREAGRNHRSGSNIPREHGFAAMGIPLGTMTTAEISDAIPRAYSRYVAQQFLNSRSANAVHEHAPRVSREP